MKGDNCDVCGESLLFAESVEWGRCIYCRASAPPKRAFVLALADRIYAAHEVLGNRAERRAVVLTEVDACPLTGCVANEHGRAA